MLNYLKKLTPIGAYQILRRGIHRGDCPLCEQKTVFFKTGEWNRDNYRCLRCLSIPRQRALLQVMHDMLPAWRAMKIHESSASGASYKKLTAECSDYVTSQFFTDVALGASHQGFVCQDLARQTFADEVFDLVITQDVLEHLLEPVESLQEIARTLKPGGVHLFTVPWYYWQETKIRAKLKNKAQGANNNANTNDGVDIEYIETPDYHQNPVDESGSLVVTEWGKDLVDTIYASSGMSTTVIRIRDKQSGIDAKFIEVFLSTKPSVVGSSNVAEQLTANSLRHLTTRWG